MWRKAKVNFNVQESNLNKAIYPRDEEVAQERANYRKAEADYRSAQKKYERTKALFDQGAVSAEELDDAETEKTVREALGARRRDILTQFLIEAVVLCVLGGIIGMALGIGGAYLIAKLAKWPPLVSWWTALLAFGFSAGVGVVFGILPANKAARLNSIEALRRD